MNDENLTLRDKFAIEIMNALIASTSRDTTLTVFINVGPDYADAAYKIADAMRKARLQSFT